MNNKVKELEDILGVKLEPYEYEKREKNSYQIYKQFNQDKDIHKLYLNNLHIESFNNVNNIFGLTIKDATISSLSELLKIKNLYRLTLENVSFENSDNEIILNETLLNITIRNTTFNAVSLINCIALKFAFFTNCKIDHSYAISELPKIYQLEFNNCSLEKLEHYTKHSNYSKNHQWLRISNMTFENINSFICFQETKNITLINCNIKYISDLYLFEKLDSFHIDSNTNTEYTAKTTHKHQKIYCKILQSEQVINLKNIFPIIHYIDKLHFENLKVDKLDFIENFINVKYLSFDKSDVYLDSFLDISSNIETLNLQDSTFKKTKYLTKFTKLINIETNSETGINSLKELLPLKDQLKTFISFDDEFKDIDIINQFQQLDLLKVNGAESSSLNQILSMENLKSLYLYIDFEEKEEITTINLKELKNIERLNLCNHNVNYEGFKHLKELKSLRVKYDFQKISPLPTLEKLERLQIDGEEKITLSSKEFPNLKELSIQGDNIIKIELTNLEILECPYVKHFNSFGKMLNLKKLYIQDTDKLSEILTNTPNLTHLRIDELKQTNFSILKSLQKLEYLDFSNEYLSLNENIIDITALNYLLNLKEVNLFGFKKLENQLNNPEIAVYRGIGQIHFHIYEEDDLWI
ncbi:hypothetical protein [Tenacibaculum sp. nBUS_03]|uniref:hypothetical protein n=1 Tax=Tenacibaculum sp. nBUS_03 TaxID=3395320 RepID=UPI003EBADAF6